MTGCSSGQCLDEKWIVVRTWMITIRPIIPRINLTIPNFMTECVTSPNLVVVLFRSTANHHNGLEPPAIWLVHFGVRDVKRDEASNSGSARTSDWRAFCLDLITIILNSRILSCPVFCLDSYRCLPTLPPTILKYPGFLPRVRVAQSWIH